MSDLIKYRVQLPPGSPPERGPGWTDLWVREGTSDESVIQECFVLDVYHVRGMVLKPTPPATLAEFPVNSFRPRVIDLGACTGIFSALACQMWPNAEVVAVEPNDENAGLAMRNTGMWSNRCEVIRAAVGASGGHVSTVGDGATGHTEPAPSGLGDVLQLTLEQLIAEKMVALLKVDVEGVEYATFDAVPSSALTWVDQIVMEWHGPEMAPWAFGDRGNILYGDLLHKLALTHAVNVLGRPERGGMLFAHRYPD